MDTQHLYGTVVVVLLLRGFYRPALSLPPGMENSTFQGERILVNKWSYGLRVPFMFALLPIIVGKKVLYGNKIL